MPIRIHGRPKPLPSTAGTRPHSMVQLASRPTCRAAMLPGYRMCSAVVERVAMTRGLIPPGKRADGVTPRPAPAAGAPRVYVETYGCQMNVADSDLIGSVLGDSGYAAAQRGGGAGVIVVNTCAVREKAEDRVIARAAELGAVKRRRPGTVLAIVGCMAEHLKDRLAERAPAVDVIAGPDSYRRLPDLLAQSRARLRPALAAAA